MTLTASLKVKTSKSSRTTSSSRLRLAEPTDILKWGQLTVDFISWTRARLLHLDLLNFVHLKVILDHFSKIPKHFRKTEKFEEEAQMATTRKYQISVGKIQKTTRGALSSPRLFCIWPAPTHPPSWSPTRPNPLLGLFISNPAQLSSPPYPSFRPQPPPLSNPSSTSPKTTLFWNYDPPVDLLTRQWRYLSYSQS